MNNQQFYYKVTFLAICMAFFGVAQAQLTPLAGAKICLDPGHGGEDSDDRPTELGIGTLYYESNGVWAMAGYLDSMLVKLGADVKITKTTNDPDSPLREPSLTDRVEVGNAFGADFFHSIHTNGSDNQSANYTLVLYAGPTDGTADDPNSLVMADIMADELFVYMRTTNTIARADIPFTRFTNGLGVLNNLNMPGVLSEGSFHSNTNEGRRLMSEAYRKAAAWGFVKSFLEYYEKPSLPYGEIGGVVTDREGAALNGIVVTLNPGEANEKVFTGDDFLNGYYLFDWLPAGDYEVKFEKFGYDAQSQTVTVTDGDYSEIDISLSEVGGAPIAPVMKYAAPFGTDGVKAEWLPNGDLTLLGYRLYYATDDTQENWALAADENTLTALVTEIEIDSKANFVTVPDKDVYHFKLTAVAESGAESGSRFVFSRSSSASGDKVLIVDGFDRRNGSFTETYHTFSSDYFEAIRETRIAEVTTTKNEYILDGSLLLSDYDMVVWYLGDESTVDETFDASEQGLVKTYLENGGKLFVSGSEVAWDLGSRGTEDDKDFLNNYLKAEFVGDGVEGYTPAKGTSGTSFEGLEIPFGITYPEDFPDAIAPSTGAVSVFDYNADDIYGGIVFTGKIGGGTKDAAIVYISFPLETADSFEQKLVMRSVLKYLEVGDFFPVPPSRPVLQSVAGNGAGVKATWTSNTDFSLEGYRLYYATTSALDDWKLAADESDLKRASTELSISELSEFSEVPGVSPNYFRLTAIAEGGFESAPSDVYAAKDAGESLSVLIVDGFDRLSGSYANPDHSFTTNYFVALNELQGLNIVSSTNENVVSGGVLLSDYSMVFWYLGDESTVQETFSLVEQDALKAYLEDGGRLFVCGSEIGWDLSSKGDPADKAFYKDYLKAAFVSDGGAGQSPAKGISSTDFSSLNINFGVQFDEDFPDQINALDGAQNVLEYATPGTFAGISYKGSFGSSTTQGAIVHFSFPLESASQADITSTVATIVDYFGVLNPAAPLAQNDEVFITSDSTVSIDVLANDTDVNGDLDATTLVVATAPANGTATIVNGKITYQAKSGFGGVDTFTYTVSDEAGMKSNVATVTANVVSVLSTEIALQSSMVIYPNPSEGATYLQVDLVAGSNREISWEIYNMEGRRVAADLTQLASDQNTINLQTEELSQGTYLVRVQNAGQVFQFKIVRK